MKTGSGRLDKEEVKPHSVWVKGYVTYLPLAREVTVTGGDTKEESIVVHKVIWCNNGIIGLGGSVKQFENVL